MPREDAVTPWAILGGALINVPLSYGGTTLPFGATSSTRTLGSVGPSDSYGARLTTRHHHFRQMYSSITATTGNLEHKAQ